MAGELDVYQLCPCGSGKKLKFCCQAIVDDMLKVAVLHRQQQHQAALAAIEAVEKKPLREVWSRAWVKSTKALACLSIQDYDQARKLVGEVLQELPDHPFSLGLNAMLALMKDEYPGSMRAIYKAFRNSAESHSDLLAQTANMLGKFMAVQGHFIGARQNLLLAVQLDPDNRDLIEDLLEFEGDTSVPYPLRGEAILADFTGNDAQRPQFDQAKELAVRGCFSDAAKGFGQLCRNDQTNFGLWWNIALCHAAAGEDPLAVQAFKAASANQPDVETAADCLLLARLLNEKAIQPQVEHLNAMYRVQSVGKLLTTLDQQERFARQHIPPAQPGEETEGRPAAWYVALDRNPKSVRDEDLTPENIAHEAGQVYVFDAAGDQPARAHLSAYGKDKFDALVRDFAAAGGADVQPDGEPKTSDTVPAEVHALMQMWFLPESLSHGRRRDLMKVRAERVVNSLWPDTPQDLLDGKSPKQAAGDSSMTVKLIAATSLFDVFCERARIPADMGGVRASLGLPAAAKIDVKPEDEIGKLSILALRRVEFEKLTDEQLVRVSNRITRLGHRAMSERVITAVLARPPLVEKVDASRLYMTLANLCRARFDVASTLEWITRGKEYIRAKKGSLHDLVMWELEELMQRAEDPDDPQLPALANSLWNFYAPKLPQFREVIAGMLNELGLPGPWNSPTVAAGPMEELAAAGTTAPDTGLWTPGAEPASQPSKLWLPGQS